MDKLRPILKQKYWICFGLAMIFVLYGWWAASAALTTKIVERKTSVEASFKEAENGKTDPNELWVAAGKKENDEDNQFYKTASLQLWKRQQKVREWPEQISSKMQGVTYFAEVATRETRERWVSIYQRQIEDLIKIVKPFENHTGNGLVVFDANRITKQDYNKWKVNLPSSNEIWSSQEDIWLLKALLTSIAKTNDSATRITESQVREIKRLHLRGGDRNTVPGAVTGAGGMGMGGASGMGGLGFRDVDKDDDKGGGGGAMMSGAALSGNQSHPGTPFVGGSGGDILAEEFGGRGGAAGFAGGNIGFRDVDSDKESGGRGMGVAAPEVRYVDGADSDIGYKTRAFLLDVVIQDERLPDLLAKLTNSDFPVEIVRVEITPHTATGGGGFGGMMTGTNVDDDDDRKGGRLGGIAGLGGLAFGGGGGGFGNGGFGGGGFGGGGFGGGGFNQPALGGPGFGGNNGLYGNANGTEVEVSPLEVAKATETLNAAMSDPSLIEVHIGGLLTLYMTPAETEMQAKAEESDAKEAATAAPAATSDATSSAGAADAVPTDAVPDASEALPQADVTSPEQPAEPPNAQPADQVIDQSTEQPADTSAESVDAPVP